MKTNLKYISAILFCYIIAATENANAAERFALQAGLENTTVTFKNKPNNILGKTGFTIGGLGEFSLNDKETWIVNLEMSVTLRGYKEEYSTGQYILHNRVYMGDAFTLSYRFRIAGDNFSILPYAGPYFEMLMSVSDSQDNKYEDYNKYMNFFDWGVKAGVAVEIVRNIQFAVEKNIGLYPIYKDSDTKMTNTGTRFCVRLFF